MGQPRKSRHGLQPFRSVGKRGVELGRHDTGGLLEAILRLGYDFGPVTLQGTAAVQPPGWSPYGTSYFLGGRAIWRTPLWGIVLVGDLGYQWIQNNERYGTPDYLSYAILAARDLGHGFALVAGWSGTNIPRTQCAGGAKTCDGRFVAGIAWRF